MRVRIIPQVCGGEAIVALAMSEPDAGSALTDLKTQAVRKGDEWVLSGTKRWYLGAWHEDFYVVYCRMSDEKGTKSTGSVLVSKNQTGVVFSEKEKHMGFRGLPSADIYFDEVVIKHENVVVNSVGFKKLMHAFDLD